MDYAGVLPGEDLAVYEAAGYGGSGKTGMRPALIVIDVTWGFLGHEPLPVLESIKQYPNSCGERGWAALEPIASVVDAFRARETPIFYTAGVTDHFAEQIGRWRDKHPSTLSQPADAHEIVDRVAPRPDDILIRKTKPSAFFGTPLIATLVDLAVDSLVVTGCTTSGCVRATVLDSFSYGLHTVVVEDGVFDRAHVPHVVNLFDIQQKYAEVRDAASVVSFVKGL